MKKRGARSTVANGGGVAAPATKSVAWRVFMWLLAALATATATVASGVYLNLIAPITSWMSSGAQELACRSGAPEIEHDDQKFRVLLTPLVGDSNQIHLRRIFTALANRHFNVIAICDPVKIDPRLGTDGSLKAIRLESLLLLQKYRADLLIFGEIAKSEETVELWEVNSSGGCEPKPRVISFARGTVSSSSTLEQGFAEGLIAETVSAIAAACSHEATTDWNMVERRTEKVKTFLDSTPAYLSSEQIENIEFAYSDATVMLYQQGMDPKWFDIAYKLNERFVNRYRESSPPKFAFSLSTQAQLLVLKNERRADPELLRIAIKLSTEAQAIFPSAAHLYTRGLAYEAANHMHEAEADLVAAVAAYPSQPEFSQALKKLRLKLRK